MAIKNKQQKISAVMDKFEQQFENLDLNSKYMENAIDSTTAQTMPEAQVDSLMAQFDENKNENIIEYGPNCHIADEHGLEFESEINKVGVGKAKVKESAPADEEKDLEARLKKLQGI
ncbi:hypothetical protein RFI_06066 [Reticulomyxa filosa]|uniref:Uncharacterized protein n=1 Tax=Reticulomyxa filosa TaxID=46433 RepID=X6P0K1_RETFI|nr:hypothetical protein RFI_06066 [Reticulomyxa filosa]|eukprot:ETO31057.1 hypothetical protein RFI_06066 [Reticulomyxa filosa]